jgi:hypothetical protein
MIVDIYEICGNIARQGISAVFVPQGSDPRNLLAFEGTNTEFRPLQRSLSLEQGVPFIGYSSTEVIEAINTNGFYCASGGRISIDER